ncbi:hypothetical protein KP509_15G037100 [Ceratopteris richardii]|uniref:Uncharacterized protein n=1 Tax=Ceratopteris richardii TaxID=49495 RepID=A0A8T2T6W2_CERRI|nr:hypothetical protein KP509_15G037100 [Ceratopteris richardii]
MGLLSAWDRSLPNVLGTPLFVWIQWVYAVWQLVRKNALVILLVSLPLQFILKRKRTIVILANNRPSSSSGYNLNTEDENEILRMEEPVRRYHSFDHEIQEALQGNELELRELARKLGEGECMEHKLREDRRKELQKEVKHRLRRFQMKQFEIKYEVGSTSLLESMYRARQLVSRTSDGEEAEGEETESHTEARVLRCVGQWAKILYTPRNQFYIVRGDALITYKALRRRFQRHEVVFATDNLQVTPGMAVARRISYDDAMDMIFTRRGHYDVEKARELNSKIFLTLVNSREINSMMWAVLSLFPLYFQIHNHNKMSNLLSIVLISLDVNKSWIYEAYIALTFHIIKWIKLHWFKDRRHLYMFFSMFSSRWMYNDSNKKKAYVIPPRQSIVVSDFCKFKDEMDIHFPDRAEVGSFRDMFTRAFCFQGREENMKDEYYEVDNDRAYFALRRDLNMYVRVITNKPLFVP